MSGKTFYRMLSQSEVDSVVQGLLRPGLREFGEQRVEARYPLAITITIDLLDRKRKPTGRTLEVLTRDISHGGIGILSRAPIHEPFILVRLPSDGGELTVISEIVWRERIGSGAYHRLGLRFLLR